MINLMCPACSRLLTVSSEQVLAGQATCPHCGAVFVVEKTTPVAPKPGGVRYWLYVPVFCAVTVALLALVSVMRGDSKSSQVQRPPGVESSPEVSEVDVPPPPDESGGAPDSHAGQTSADEEAVRQEALRLAEEAARQHTAQLALARLREEEARRAAAQRSTEEAAIRQDEARARLLESRVQEYLGAVMTRQNIVQFDLFGLKLPPQGSESQGSNWELEAKEYEYSDNRMAAKVKLLVTARAGIGRSFETEELWVYHEEKGSWFIYRGPWAVATAMTGKKVSPWPQECRTRYNELVTVLADIHQTARVGHAAVEHFQARARSIQELLDKSAASSAPGYSPVGGTSGIGALFDESTATTALDRAVAACGLDMANQFRRRADELNRVVSGMEQHMLAVGRAMAMCRAGQADCPVHVPDLGAALKKTANRPLMITCQACARFGASGSCAACEGRGQIPFNVSLEFPDLEKAPK